MPDERSNAEEELQRAREEKLRRLWEEAGERDQRRLLHTICDHYLKTLPSGEKCFDFNGVLLPDFRHEKRLTLTLHHNVGDTFFFHLFRDGKYDRDSCELMDVWLLEGPYCYEDELTGFIVKPKPGDIVLDAGAFVGEFSALAAHMGATVYAFEPSPMQYKYLCETARLNENAKITPVKKALADKAGEGQMMYIKPWAAADVLKFGYDFDPLGEETEVTTVDDFVRENNLQRVDFIKADIEGAERKMLAGAKETLARYAPKLALCTYHNPDDPQVLEEMILEANPAYRVVHLRKKLFACVPGKSRTPSEKR